MMDPVFHLPREGGGRRGACGAAGWRRGALVWAFFVLQAIVPPVLRAQTVECPPITVKATPMAGAMLLEWDQPDPSIISSLALIDTNWGGTAHFEFRGDYDGFCDLDMKFRSVKEVPEFTGPFVGEPTIDRDDPVSPNYWGGARIRS